MRPLLHPGTLPGTLPSTLNGTSKRRLLWLAPLLMLCLLLAQSVDLVHNHNGDLEQRFDCQVCLKLGANTVAAAAADFSFELTPDGFAIDGEGHSAPFIALPTPRSRAPPGV